MVTIGKVVIGRVYWKGMVTIGRVVTIMQVHLMIATTVYQTLNLANLTVSGSFSYEEGLAIE